MTHQWHDAYRHGSTPAHHLDPRSKLFAGLAFVGVVLFTRQWGLLQKAGYPALLLCALVLMKLPLGAVLKRTLSILPFALLMLLSAVMSRLSLRHLAEALAKSLLSVTAMALVSMTTPFPDFLRALEQCRTPRILVLFLAFLYRYAAVLGRETVRVERGWSSRSFGRFWWLEWSRLGHVLAALLIRSYERAERVYAAMLSRGFSSRMPAMHLLHFGMGDFVFVTVSSGLLFLVRWGRF
jgi:cobalt/nickel transport system permease protein